MNAMKIEVEFNMPGTCPGKRVDDKVNYTFIRHISGFACSSVLHFQAKGINGSLRHVCSRKHH